MYQTNASSLTRITKRFKPFGMSLTILEDRSVPAVGASIVNGGLFVYGAASQPGGEVRIESENDQVRVFDGAKLVGNFGPVRNVDVRMNGDSEVLLNGKLQGNLRVMQDAGSITLNGVVQGDAEFGPDNSRMGPRDVSEPLDLTINGRVFGAMSIEGTSRDDDVAFSAESEVGGLLMMNLYRGEDRVYLGGRFGYMAPPDDGLWADIMKVDLGDGNDTLTIGRTADINAGNSTIQMGAGDDRFIVEPRATYYSLNVDGGAGYDTYEIGGDSTNINLENFEK